MPWATARSWIRRASRYPPTRPGLRFRTDPASATAQADYDEGRKLEKQTNALIGVTSAFAAATVALAFFTDFKGKDSSSDKEPAANSLTMNATRQGAVLGWTGSF